MNGGYSPLGSPRLGWVKTIAAGGMMAGMLLSPKLWLGGRAYPTAPVVELLPAVPAPWDALWFGCLLGLLLFIAILPRPRVLIWVFLASAVLFALWDQTRWQPWAYLYLALLAAVGIGRDDESALNVCRFLMAATYFWSGLQKLGPGFTRYAFPWLLQPLLRPFGVEVDLAEPVPLWLVVAGWGAGLLEAGIGVGLLFRPTRRFAVPLALGMHVLLLAMIGPFGHNWNSVVWPWNVAMMLLVVTLFARTPTLGWRAVVWPGRSLLHAAAVLLFGVMPLFSFWGWWDSYFSAALYSGNTVEAWVVVSPTVYQRLPPEAHPHATLLEDGRWRIDVMGWSMEELNAPNNPERRIHFALTRRLQALADDPSEVGLLLQERPDWWSGESSETWYDGRTLAGQR